MIYYYAWLPHLLDGGGVVGEMVLTYGNVTYHTPVLHCVAPPTHREEENVFERPEQYGYYCPATVLPGDPYGALEDLWTASFTQLFSNFSHVWKLEPIHDGGKGLQFTDSAKVRFHCQNCGHGWTSMKGRSNFWIHFNSRTGFGVIKFKLYGQKCLMCTSGGFETPMWYPEEVQKVVRNLYNKVGQKFYQFIKQPVIKQRRTGRPMKPHKPDACQACIDGLCVQRQV